MTRPTRVAAGLAAVLIAVPVAAAAQDLPAQTADASSAQEALAPAPENAPEEPLGAEDVAQSGEEPVAHGLIKYPPVLTLDGATYFLNKDGHTFVADVTRVNADVTPEEMAASEAMVAANAGEVGRQGLEAARAGGEADVDRQYVAPARGLEAETGSNALARAVFALLLASALGAAFFAVARRRLV